ncbi:MAG: type II toxin-antitoxin system RelE/ParE family toxin [Pirellulales bacterium]
MKNYRLSRQASRDVVEVCKYIARDNPTAAKSFARQLHERLALLVRFPESGEQFTDSRGGQYRRVSFGNYVVYFRSVSGKVQVCRLVHGAQQLDRLEE